MTLQVTYWEDVRDRVAELNPELAKIVDGISPDKRYPLVKMKYHFGQHILDQGHFKVPIDKELKTLDQSGLSSDLIHELTYNQIPLAMPLNGAIEIYFIVGNRIIPFNLVKPGKFMALWTSLEPNPMDKSGGIWFICAGTRSLYLCPKMGDANSFRKLKRRWLLRSNVPKQYHDQWPLFTELANHSFVQQDPWSVDALFFTRSWIRNDDPAWQPFKHFLMTKAWESTTFLRNQLQIDLALSYAQAVRNLKPNPYHMDTIRHLFAVGAGFYPGFQFAANDDVAPISRLQDVLINDYGLNYSPLFIQPGYVQPNETCYYSLQAPTLLDFSPRARKASSKIDDLRDMQFVLQRVTDTILQDDLNMGQSLVYKLAEQLTLDYYHSDPLATGDSIKSVSDLMQDDPELAAIVKNTGNQKFCDTSPLLRGCVSIRRDFS